MAACGREILRNFRFADTLSLAATLCELFSGNHNRRMNRNCTDVSKCEFMCDFPDLGDKSVFSLSNEQIVKLIKKRRLIVNGLLMNQKKRNSRISMVSQATGSKIMCNEK